MHAKHAAAISRLPDDVLAHAASFLTRWERLAALAPTGHRLKSGKAAHKPLKITVDPAANLILVHAGDALRACAPAVAWRRTATFNPAFDLRPAAALVDKRFKPKGDNWPTAALATPRALFVAQYAVGGVLRYDVDASGRLRYAATHAHVEDPEGLAVLKDPNLLFVLSRSGLVTCIDVRADAVRSVVSAFGTPGVIASSMIAHSSRKLLLVAAFRPKSRSYSFEGPEGERFVPAARAATLVAQCPLARPDTLGDAAVYEARGVDSPAKALALFLES